MYSGVRYNHHLVDVIPMLSGFEVQGGFDYLSRVVLGGAIQNLGTLDKASGLRLEAGCKMLLDELYLEAKAQYQAYRATFRDQSSLPGNQAYDNAEFSENNLNLMISAGTTF